MKLASSLNNANAGTAIDITDQGTDGATHTFTATSLAGGSVKLQASNDDGSTWVDVPTPINNKKTLLRDLPEVVESALSSKKKVETIDAYEPEWP